MCMAVLGVVLDDKCPRSKEVLVLHRVADLAKMSARLAKAFGMWAVKRNTDCGKMSFCEAQRKVEEDGFWNWVFIMDLEFAG